MKDKTKQMLNLIKQDLINLSKEDNLPLDLNDLSLDDFKESSKEIENIVDALETLATDAQMALDDSWDRSDDGFFDQLDLIERLGIYGK